MGRDELVLPTSAARYYHVAFVVADLPTTMAATTARLGIGFRPVEQVTMAFTASAADVPVPFDITVSYSIDGPPAIELIQAIPGTFLDCADEASRFHHLGWWTASLGADSDGLGAAGCPLAWRDGDPAEAPNRCVFHTSPLGGFVELVSSAVPNHWLADLQTGPAGPARG